MAPSATPGSRAWVDGHIEIERSAARMRGLPWYECRGHWRVRDVVMLDGAEHTITGLSGERIGGSNVTVPVAVTVHYAEGGWHIGRHPLAHLDEHARLLAREPAPHERPQAPRPAQTPPEQAAAG